MTISKDILIEDLIKKVPESVDYLSKNNIRCIRCGEPIWGTLEEAAKEKGYSNKEIADFVKNLNDLEK